MRRILLSVTRSNQNPETPAADPIRIDLVARDACAWPVAVCLGGGAGGVGLVYHNRPSHGFHEGDLEAVTSTDGGTSWQPAGVPAPHKPGANRVHAAAGLNHAGEWIALSTGHVLRDGRMAGLAPVWFSRRSLQDGAWQVNRQVTVDVPAPWAIPHGRILALEDGRLAATFYQSEGRGRPSRTWVVFSEDDGQSWGGARQIGADDTNEAVLLALSPEHWLAAVRTHCDHHVDLFVTDSASGSWQHSATLTLPMQHPADLTDLGDGCILLTFGIRNRGLMGIGARLSRDAGETWGAPVVLGQFAGATDCGYPSTVCLDSKNGEMLTACYSDRSALYHGYHLLTLRWRLGDWFEPRTLGSISDGAPLES